MLITEFYRSGFKVTRQARGSWILTKGDRKFGPYKSMRDATEMADELSEMHANGL